MIQFGSARPGIVLDRASAIRLLSASCGAHREVDFMGKWAAQHRSGKSEAERFRGFLVVLGEESCLLQSDGLFSPYNSQPYFPRHPSGPPRNEIFVAAWCGFR
jgi:hypothetical protein